MIPVSVHQFKLISLSGSSLLSGTINGNDCNHHLLGIWRCLHGAWLCIKYLEAMETHQQIINQFLKNPKNQLINWKCFLNCKEWVFSVWINQVVIRLWINSRNHALYGWNEVDINDEKISLAHERINHHYQQLYCTPLGVSFHYLRSITESQWEDLREYFMISQGHLAITMMANQISNVGVGNISYRYVHG